jgi:Protein of unknown function (DUF998)
MGSGPGKRWLSVGTLLLAVIALLAAARASITMIYMNLAFHDEFNPVTTPLSYYALADGGSQMFTSAAVALAIGVLAVLLGMARAGVRMAGRPTVLFSVWALCLVLSAVFPIDDAPVIMTFAGWMHQFAGAGILAFLSVAGLAATPRLAEHPAWRPIVGTVRTLSIGAAVLATAYIVSRLDDVFPGVFGEVDIGGFLQRGVLAFDIAVVAALAVQLVRVSWPAVRSRAAAPTNGTFVA